MIHVAQESIYGHWEGVLVREGAELEVTFEFTQEHDVPNGTFGSRTLRVMEIPLRHVTYTYPRVHFELAGDETATIFDGDLKGSSIEGTFREADAGGIFTLTRGKTEPLPYTTEEVHFQNREVVLSGTLFVPSTRGPHPAIICLHGSGPEGRFASHFLADSFARHGIETLIYDKRGVGRSTGDWRNSNFDKLAEDALAGIELLKIRSEIDPNKIGVYGQSQGGFITPLIASRSKDVSFIVAVSSHGGAVFEQDLYRIQNALHASIYSEDEIARAMAWYTLFNIVARTGEGSEAFDAATQSVRNEKWFSFLHLPPKDHWLWKFYKQIGNFNPLPFWEKVSAPVLLIWGERDQIVPVTRSLSRIESALRRGGNKHYTIRVFPNADHTLRIRPKPGAAFDWPRSAPRFVDLLNQWVQKQVDKSDRHHG